MTPLVKHMAAIRLAELNLPKGFIEEPALDLAWKRFFNGGCVLMVRNTPDKMLEVSFLPCQKSIDQCFRES